jgi:hypothetical protein
VLKRVRLTEATTVSQHERDFDDPRCTSSHKRIAKDAMDHRAEWNRLWVRTHAPSREQNNNARNQVSSWSAMSRSRQPYTKQASTPPDYAHSCVLKIISNPWTTPSMLSECVDSAPSSNEKRVKEFLTSTCPSQPELANQKYHSHHNSITDECAAHDKVRETLA